jgi:PAS domain S-box-containing protein
MDDSPLSSDDPRESILGVFAARAGAELERKRIREALQTSEERFRNYFKLQSIGIAITSTDKRWLEINEELCNIVGYSREELLGRSWTEFTHPDDLEANLELFGRAVAGEIDDYSLNKRFIRKDGRVVHVKLSARCVRESGGTLDYCLVLCEDVTERLKGQTALRRYEQIVSASSDLLAFLDVTYTYQAVNTAYVEAFGRTKEDIVGRAVSEVINPEIYQARIKPHLDECLSGKRVSFQHWFDLPGKGRRYLDVHYNPFYETDGALSGIVVDIRDITERKEAANKLRQYQDRLRTLASRISFVEERERRRIGAELHDRTLQCLGLAKIKLGTIRADTSFAGRSPDLEHVYELVDQSIQDTRALVFDLSPPVLYELGFEPAIEWLAESVQERGHIRCEVHQQEQRVSLATDVEIALFQSVRELLVNIEKHANAGHATVTLESEHNAIRVCVEDDGDGFDVSTLRTHSTVQGGLGLFGIRERLLLFGGYVDITSTAGEGTRVTLAAPLKASGGTT